MVVERHRTPAMKDATGEERRPWKRRAQFLARMEEYVNPHVGGNDSARNELGSVSMQTRRAGGDPARYEPAARWGDVGRSCVPGGLGRSMRVQFAGSCTDTYVG